MTYSRQPWSARWTIKSVIDAEALVKAVNDLLNTDITGGDWANAVHMVHLACNGLPREVHELLDADGRVIATFTDARDMDLVTGGFPTREDVAALTDELNDALAERDDEARAVNTAETALEEIATILRTRDAT